MHGELKLRSLNYRVPTESLRVVSFTRAVFTLASVDREAVVIFQAVGALQTAYTRLTAALARVSITACGRGGSNWITFTIPASCTQIAVAVL